MGAWNTWDKIEKEMTALNCCEQAKAMVNCLIESGLSICICDSRARDDFNNEHRSTADWDFAVIISKGGGSVARFVQELIRLLGGKYFQWTTPDEQSLRWPVISNYPDLGCQVSDAQIGGFNFCWSAHSQRFYYLDGKNKVDIRFIPEIQRNTVMIG